jgi:hypothetical protein
MAKQLPPNTLDIRNSDGIQPTGAKKKRLRLRLGKYQLVVLVITLLATGAAGVVMLMSHKPAPTSGEVAAKDIAAKVSKHYLLPKDELPALATVTNKDKLTTELFKQSENGDKILIYQKNKLAIIYRPGKDRIVAVGPVSIDKPTVDKKQP